MYHKTDFSPSTSSHIKDNFTFKNLWHDKYLSNYEWQYYKKKSASSVQNEAKMPQKIKYGSHQRWWWTGNSNRFFLKMEHPK